MDYDETFEIPVTPAAAPEVCSTLTNVLMNLGYEVQPSFKDNNGRLMVLLLSVSMAEDGSLQPSL